MHLPPIILVVALTKRHDGLSAEAVQSPEHLLGNPVVPRVARVAQAKDCKSVYDTEMGCQGYFWQAMTMIAHLR